MLRNSTQHQIEREYNNTNPPSDKDFIQWLKDNHWEEKTVGPLTLMVNTLKVVEATNIFDLYNVFYQENKYITVEL